MRGTRFSDMTIGHLEERVAATTPAPPSGDGPDYDEDVHEMADEVTYEVTIRTNENSRIITESELAAAITKYAGLVNVELVDDVVVTR